MAGFLRRGSHLPLSHLEAIFLHVTKWWTLRMRQDPNGYVAPRYNLGSAGWLPREWLGLEKSQSHAAASQGFSSQRSWCLKSLLKLVSLYLCVKGEPFGRWSQGSWCQESPSKWAFLDTWFREANLERILGTSVSSFSDISVTLGLCNSQPHSNDSQAAASMGEGGEVRTRFPPFPKDAGVKRIANLVNLC